MGKGSGKGGDDFYKYISFKDAVKRSQLIIIGEDQGQPKKFVYQKKLPVDKNDTARVISFLFGCHKRLGSQSSIYQSFHCSCLFEPALLQGMFEFFPARRVFQYPYHVKNVKVIKVLYADEFKHADDFKVGSILKVSGADLLQSMRRDLDSFIDSDCSDDGLECILLKHDNADYENIDKAKQRIFFLSEPVKRIHRHVYPYCVQDAWALIDKEEEVTKLCVKRNPQQTAVSLSDSDSM